MIFSLSQITTLLARYGYILIVPLVMAEGPIITIIIGSLAALGIFNLIYAYPIIILSDLASDSIYYVVGRFGGEKFLNHCGRWTGVNPELLQQLKGQFNLNCAKALYLGKISHGIGGIFLFVAGLAKLKYTRFLWYNLLATLVKSLILLLIGYFITGAISKANSLLQIISVVTICLFLIASVIYLTFQKKNTFT